MQCPEQMALCYIDGLAPKQINQPMEFGSIMHYALEHQFSYGSPEDCIYSITDQYRRFREKTLLHSGERDILNDLLGLAEVTFPLYCRHWKDDDERIQWVEREAKFKVPYEVITPEGPRSLLLRGMRDGVYRVPKTNSLGVFETKNKSRIVESDISDGLKADMQTLFYVVATYLERGEMPEQVTYNVIRRSSLYRRKGDKRKGTSPENTRDYLKRVKEDIESNPDEYFIRWKCDLVSSDVVGFINRTLNPLLCTFIKWWDSVKKNPTRSERWQESNRSPYHFQNLTALVGKYGKAAEWEAIVNNRLKPFRIKSVPFPELEESFLVTP